MIWRIFKKDWTLLWPFVLIVAATHAINATMWLILGTFQEPETLQRLANLFVPAVILGVAALTAILVHQDALPGDRQDWLVRPVSRRDMLLAKLLFLLLAIHGPMLLVDIAECLVSGLSFGDALSAALSRNIYTGVFLTLPIFALASMTSTVVEVIGAILVACIVAVLFMVSMSASMAGSFMGSFVKMSNGELMLEFWQTVILVAAAIVIPLQYFRRATGRARLITLGVILLLIPVSAAMPFEAAFAVLQSVSPDQAAAKPIAIAFDPALGKYAPKPGSPNPANSIWLPLRLSGLSPDSIVLNDRTNVRITGRDGTILYRGVSVGDAQGNIDDLPVRTTMGGDVPTHQLVVLPRKIWDLVHSQPVRIDLDYSLTLFRADRSGTIPAVNGSKRIADLGLCKTKMDEDGDEIEFGCLGSRELVTCATVILENSASGRRNPPRNVCQKYYLPYNAHFDPDAMMHLKVNLAFRDPQGLAKYPVDSSQLASAQVSVKTYAPVAHFTRHLTIPTIRLGDWEAEPLQATVGAAAPPT